MSATFCLVGGPRSSKHKGELTAQHIAKITRLDQEWLSSDADEKSVRLTHLSEPGRFLYFLDHATRQLIGYAEMTVPERTTLRLDWLCAPGRGSKCMDEVLAHARTLRMRRVILTVSVDPGEAAAATRARLLLYMSKGFTACDSVFDKEHGRGSIRMQLFLL